MPSPNNEGIIRLAKRVGTNDWDFIATFEACHNDGVQAEPGGPVSMVLDATDDPHLVSKILDTGDDVAALDYTSWKQPWAPTSESAYNSTSGYHYSELDFDDQDYGWICRIYKKSGAQNYDLKVINHTGSTWSETTVETNVGFGDSYARACDVGVAPDGTIGII